MGKIGKRVAASGHSRTYVSKEDGILILRKRIVFELSGHGTEIVITFCRSRDQVQHSELSQGSLVERIPWQW